MKQSKTDQMYDAVNGKGQRLRDMKIAGKPLTKREAEYLSLYETCCELCGKAKSFEELANGQFGIYRDVMLTYQSLGDRIVRHLAHDAIPSLMIPKKDQAA